MTTEIAEPTQAAAPTSKNSFERLAGVLFSPGETFRDIAQRPDFLVPLLLIVVFGYVSSIFTLPRFDYESMQAAQAEQLKKKNPNISDADIERMSGMTRASVKVMTWIGPVIMIAWYAIVAVVLWGAFRLFGGEGTFKQAFSATVYSWMPLLIYGIIATIVIVARGTFDPVHAATTVKSNPAFLFDMKEQPVAYALASSFDIFTIWTVVLLIIGFAALAKTTRAKAAGIILSMWGVLILIKLGFAAMNA